MPRGCCARRRRGRLGPGSVAQALLGLPDAVGVLVARADVPGALAAQRALLVAAETTARPLELVAVGVRGRMSADVAELAAALEHPVSGVVPAYWRQLRRAVQSGQLPTAGRLGRAYQVLAAALWPIDTGEPHTVAGRRRHRRRRGPIGHSEQEAASA